MAKLTGKIAVVTGASRGIGRAIALELSLCGASVIINYSKDQKGAYETLRLIKKQGGYGILKKCDLSDKNNIKLFVKEIENMFGKIDILVNNAGISIVGIFEDSKDEDIEKIINTNLKAAVYLSREVLKVMTPQKKGSIVNISSMWGQVGASCEVLYSMTKGAIDSFTKALAKEMAPSNIRVNAVSPGVIDTTMNSFLGENERKDLEEEIPIGRFGKPEEIAKTVSFLCSNDASYITGQILRVDGALI